MSDEKKRCQATTRTGDPCKKWARAGSDYCYMHQVATANEPVDLHQLAQELDDMASRLQQEEPTYTPPPFSPLNLLKLIRQNIDRFTPDVQLSLLRELQDSLQGASAKDMLDPATWKGLFYLLQYTIQVQSSELRERINHHLVKVPGGETLVTLQSMLEGASPKDMLDPDMWKGMWYVVNYSLQNQAQDVKRRILGEETE